MGLRIKGYSLKELHRISLPGTVVPSLFWMLPVGRWEAGRVEQGRWENGQLDPIWHLFKHEPGTCHDVGLFLAKDDFDQHGPAVPTVELGQLGAHLKDLLPNGVDEYSDIEEECTEDPGLLFLSGAFPQPGWGVLLRSAVHLRDASNVEALVHEAVNNMADSAAVEKSLQAIVLATKLFHSQERDGSAPTPQDNMAFRRALDSAIKYQWNYGPRFLWSLEKVARQRGYGCSTVVWDPPRMIGWKLWASHLKTTVEDLHQASRKLLGGKVDFDPSGGDATAALNGSFFTDYVHYLASVDITRPAHETACLLLEDLVRPTECRTVFQALGQPYDDSWSAHDRCAHLLDILGWSPRNGSRIRSLAACIRMSGDAAEVPADVGFNEVRISAESFCKDLLDVLTHGLSLDSTTVWGFIASKCPDYRRSSGNWDVEVRNITIGSANLLISTLARELFLDRPQEVTNLDGALARLLDGLNPLSHHQENADRWSRAAARVGPAVHDTLSAVHQLITEMPWHFSQVQNVGKHPKVLTGKGWSHSHPQERMLRILLWTGARYQEGSLIWNPLLTNPIMTDPVVITRPRR